MTAEEKAKDLVEKFADYTIFRNDGGHDEEISYNNAKQCAIIAVDEAVLYHPLSTFPDEGETEFHKFWKQVKKEISNLE